MPKTYSIKQVVYVADSKRRLMTTRYITLRTGLSWRDARRLQKADKTRTYNIVPEWAGSKSEVQVESVEREDAGGAGVAVA